MCAASVRDVDPLSLVQYLDFKTYLPGDILTKVDRASMAHSLEVRTPFLDYEFVEWAAACRRRSSCKGSEGKHVLKQALEPLLPHEVLYRTKMGFAVPLDTWFRGSLRDRIRELIDGRRLAPTGFFDADDAAAPGQRAPVRHARPQRRSLVAADVRRIPAQRPAGRHK